jgi:AcrR family transcriptional regulator
VVLDDSLLTALRFGFLAVDGSRHIMGLPPRGHEDQVAFIGDLTRAFIHGHATNALRSDSLHRPPTSVKLKLQTSSRELIDSSKSRLATGNWERILRIAWQEFTSKPFKEASVDRIAKASETPKSTLYRQFSSKESLYSAATKLILLDGLQRPLTFDWRRESASDALVTTAQHLLRTFTATDSKRTHRHLIAEAGEIPSVTSEVYEFYRHIIVEFTRPLLQALRQAGLIRNLPIEVVAWRLFIMSTIGNRFLFYSPGDAKQRRQLAEGATHQFLFGLVPGSESEWSA